MTRKIYSAVLAGAAVFAATAGATSASAATATSPARARVLSAITLTNARQLDFGAVVTDPANPGTVTISPGGLRTGCTGGTMTCSGTVSSSLFNITTGGAGEIVSVDADATVSLTGPGPAMTASLVESASTVTLNASGEGSFTVGGTLNVGANQTQGVYTGTFSVTANYQ